jgi:hypothetical protein
VRTYSLLLSLTRLRLSCTRGLVKKVDCRLLRVVTCQSASQPPITGLWRDLFTSTRRADSRPQHFELRLADDACAPQAK